MNSAANPVDAVASAHVGWHILVTGIRMPAGFSRPLLPDIAGGHAHVMFAFHHFHKSFGSGALSNFIQFTGKADRCSRQSKYPVISQVLASWALRYPRPADHLKKFFAIPSTDKVSQGSVSHRILIFVPAFTVPLVTPCLPFIPPFLGFMWLLATLISIRPAFSGLMLYPSAK